MLEKKFKIEDMFNENEEYDLWILSIGAARQDLFFVNKQLIHLIENDSNDGILYYAKMSAAHVSESLALLKKAQTDYPDILRRFYKIEHFENRYQELNDLINGEPHGSFFRQVLSHARNNIFHYNKGNWIKQLNERDFESTKKVLKSMTAEKFISGFKIGDIAGEHDYYFAEEVQINWLFQLGKDFGFNERELLTHLSLITAKVMNILSLILYDFSTSFKSQHTGINIHTR